MSADDDEVPVVYSSQFGWMPADSLQSVIGQHTEPAIVFLFENTWEENLFITQHNLTIIGMSNATTVIGENGGSPITVLKPNVRLLNLTVGTEYNEPAIAFTHGPASQAVIKNVTISGSGSHGIYRDSDYGSAINAVIDCNFHDIEGHAIYAESGSGARNVVLGNLGENIGGDFIRWGVDSSILLNNYCEDARLFLTGDSRRNLIFNLEDDVSEIVDEGEENQLINQMVEPEKSRTVDDIDNE